MTLVERLAERVGTTAGTRTIYGEPVEREGITVIPVARARMALGGGGGDGEAGSGGGGGGALVVEPAGWIRVDHDGTRWERVPDSARVLGALGRLAVGLGLGAFLALRGIASVLHALRGGR